MQIKVFKYSKKTPLFGGVFILWFYLFVALFFYTFIFLDL